MRSKRTNNENYIYTEELSEEQAELVQTEKQTEPAQPEDQTKSKKQDEKTLLKLSKKELLEIMLAQGEEIDRLNAEIEELQAKLDDKNFKLSQVGSIAEASLAVTDIFKEAEKAALTYINNVRRLADAKYSSK